jgi:MSHA biogenesis protein MshE
MASTPGVRSAGRPQRVRLGDVLIAQKAISQEQLRLALEEQKRSGRRIGRVLVDLGFLAEEAIAQALGRQLNLPFVNLKRFNFSRAVVMKLPEVAARRFRALALEDRGATMLVGMADPTDLFAFDALTGFRRRTSRRRWSRRARCCSRSTRCTGAPTRSAVTPGSSSRTWAATT